MANFLLTRFIPCNYSDKAITFYSEGSQMLVHAKLESSTVNGPGNRAVIWLQGCTLNCPGCWNPNTHAFLGSKDVPLAEVQTWIMNLDGIEGITFSGGEPMQHVADVIEVAEYIRAIRPELSIGMFTGYTAAELAAGKWETLHPAGVLVPGNGKLWDMLRPSLDFAVMGRFNASKVTTDKPLCGSSNQDIVLFSDRYSDMDFKMQQTQVTVSEDGLIQITGYPGREFIKGMATV